MNATTASLARPRNAVVILLDSLNRHLLGAYGAREFQTPQIDRFCAGALRFDRHYAGSLPCMPARHDILCGALDFLWRPWGSVEVWEDAITCSLRSAGVVTQLISDHPHLFEVGGENYHTDFQGWDYVRGHETDPWKTAKNASAIGAPMHDVLPAPFPREYDTNRTWFRREEDFPGPQTMAGAARWVDENAGRHERFFLMIDEFDPHEPFDTPEPWASKYRDNGGKPLHVWPPYARDALKRGVLTEEQAREIRDHYGAKLSMIDHWLGKLLDALDRHGLADDTAVILCTDHGHYLGEHDIFGKPGVPLYQPMVHIPLMIRWPGVAPGRRDMLTTSVDIHATLADIFGVTPSHRTHGRSLLPAIADPRHEVRDHVLAGVWGREVHYIDRDHKYVRAPLRANAPLSMWSNRWSTMPVTGMPGLRLLPPDRRARIDFMPGSDVPVLRQPFVEGDMLPFWARMADFTGNHLWNVAADPGELDDLAGGALEREYERRLRAALAQIEAPDDQAVRLGLAA
jgi:arylsulfatase A-like enzyme